MKNNIGKIEKSIKKYRKFYSYHTPGHKGKLSYADITEYDDVFPSDVISDAENMTARHYNADYARFLTNGSSMGLKAAILAAGGDFLTADYSHQAIFEGAALANVNAIRIKNRTANDLNLPLSVEDIDDTLKNNRDVKAVIVTSPDYYGQTSEVQRISDYAKSKGLILIADSSHGAHFASHNMFPDGFAHYADFCVMSAHKTLRAYTQSSFMTINGKDNIKKLDNALTLLGTTSPSYLFFAALENAVIFEEDNCSFYKELKNGTDRIKADFPVLKNDDPMRLVIDCKKAGTDGRTVYKKLFDKKIIAEMYDERYVVFIITLSDTQRSVKKLYNALKETL